MAVLGLEIDTTTLKKIYNILVKPVGNLPMATCVIHCAFTKDNVDKWSVSYNWMLEKGLQVQDLSLILR